jgi:hypothetical protein
MAQNDGGPAFPWNPKKTTIVNGKVVKLGEPGMSLRDWFAGMALTGILSSRESLESLITAADLMKLDPASGAAAVSFIYADAMLEARDE